MILWVNSDLVSDGGRCHVSCYESVGASRHHIEPSCRVSDDALRRRPDVGCRTKFVAHPGGVIFYPEYFVKTSTKGNGMIQKDFGKIIGEPSLRKFVKIIQYSLLMITKGYKAK